MQILDIICGCRKGRTPKTQDHTFLVDMVIEPFFALLPVELPLNPLSQSQMYTERRQNNLLKIRLPPPAYAS